MKRTITTSSLLTAIVLLGMSTIANAEDMKIVTAGKLVSENVGWQGKPRIGSDADKFVYGGRGVILWAKKAALGDCELNAALSFDSFSHNHRDAAVAVQDCGYLRINSGRGQLEIDHSRMPYGFKPEILGPVSKFFQGGRLFTLRIKRAGDVVSFYLDGKKLAERELSSKEPMQFGFYAGLGTMRFKSVTITADKFADPVKKEYKVLFPSYPLFTGTKPSHEYGKAASYRIPALAVTTKGTILAFAEARRLSRRDVGDNDAVLRRSEDNGKTWGPEIVLMDAGPQSVNNPSPVVDPKTGRIWVFMNKCHLDLPKNWDPNLAWNFITYSDDDGKTWSKPKDYTKAIRSQRKSWRFGGGPAAGGFVMQRGKYAGRMVMPFSIGWDNARLTPGVVYSDDHGKTWKAGGTCWSESKTHLVEATGVELCNGSLLMNCRTGEKQRGLTILPDGGTKDTTKIWFTKDVPDPHCQGAMVRYSWPKDGKPGLIIYSGPGTDQGRYRMTLRGSYDDGKTWPWKQLVYMDGSGYSDVNVLPDGRLILLFEKDGKSKLEFVTIPAPPTKAGK